MIKQKSMIMTTEQYVLKSLVNPICFQVLLTVLLLMPLISFSQTSKVSVWAAPCEQKIRPEDPIEKSNLVWTGADKKINIAGAGNQHVAFQVVITTPVPEGYKPKAADGFFVEASDLISQQGKIIPKKRISLYLEHYILLYGKSSPVGATGYWPDALAPLKVPFSMQAQYEVVGSRPVWIEVAIPSGAQAGTYQGTVTVTQNGRLIERLNLEVKVYGFSLPDKTHLVTYMNISRGGLAHFYHQPASSEEIDQLTQTYYKFLYDHRMEPWFNDQLQPAIIVHNEQVTVQFNDERYRYYMDSLHTNRVLLNSFPSELKEQISSKEFSPAFKQIVSSYLSQVASYFKRNGWEDRLVFNSPIDEPNTKADYDNTRSWAELVHQAAPGIPFLATKSPVTSQEHSGWGTLRGYVNNFSIHGNALNDPAVKQAIIEEQAKGGEMTWYISCDQTYPQPNYFIDAPALDPVMIPWITARYHMNGILYWALNYWSETANPWLDAVTFHSGFLCSNGYVLNGEGSLLYPGDYTKRYTGQPDVDGPVSSIRFELLREGIEDYEYIWMLNHLGAKDFAEEQIKNLVIDVRTFSRNLEELYLTRKAMAQRLEKLAGQQ
jgi:hypothetical protein